MKKSGKNIEKSRKAVEPRPYTLQEAVPLLQKVKYAKFDETVEVTLRLGVDPKHADQMVRGTVVLPHGLGKSKKVLVIASGEKVREAEAAGADFVGGEDMVEKITKENWTDFDALIATPDMMKSVGRLGKILGPKGLMPNPKTGTVTMDVAKAVQEVKAGKVEFRTDKTCSRVWPTPSPPRATTASRSPAKRSRACSKSPPGPTTARSWPSGIAIAPCSGCSFTRSRSRPKADTRCWPTSWTSPTSTAGQRPERPKP